MINQEEIAKAADKLEELFSEFVDNRENNFLRKKCAIQAQQMLVNAGEYRLKYFDPNKLPYQILKIELDVEQVILTELKSRL